VARSPEAIWEASLYHSQQAAEKVLKGFLANWDRPIQKTNNLESDAGKKPAGTLDVLKHG
jgi:HEPN domain-containing protein